MSALDRQVGGDHYRKGTIQPIEYIHANRLGFIEGTIVKYITRWRHKGGVQDLEKIKHYVDLLIELEGRNQNQATSQTVAQPIPQTLPSRTPLDWEAIRKQMGQATPYQPLDPKYTVTSSDQAVQFISQHPTDWSAS